MAFPGIFPMSFFKTALASGYIQSIQAFEITIPNSTLSNTATISAVDTTRSVIIYGGFTTNSTSSIMRDWCPRITLTDATTVTVQRNASTATTVTVRGTVVEFTSAAVETVQFGSVALSATLLNATSTIVSAPAARSAVFYMGQTNDSTLTTTNNILTRVEITNPTTVTGTRGTGGNCVVVLNYAVVTFNASIINNIQQRVVTKTTTTSTDTDTITSVVTGNTLMAYNGTSGTNSAISNFWYYIQLLNSTTGYLVRSGTSSNSRTVGYTAIEFVNGVLSNAQRGSVTTGAGTATADIAVTSANTSKSFISWMGEHTTASNGDERQESIKLVTAVTARAERNTSTNSVTMGYELVSFTS